MATKRDLARRSYHERLTALFLRVRDLSPNAREAVLLRACADDPRMLEDVRSLLRFDEAAETADALDQ